MLANYCSVLGSNRIYLISISHLLLPKYFEQSAIRFLCVAHFGSFGFQSAASRLQQLSQVFHVPLLASFCSQILASELNHANRDSKLDYVSLYVELQRPAEVECS